MKWWGSLGSVGRWGSVYGVGLAVGLSLGLLVAFLRGADGPLRGGPGGGRARGGHQPGPYAGAGPAPSPAVVSAPSPSAVASPGAGRTFTVRPGDTLQRIALEVYGDVDQWARLYAANRERIGADPNNLQAGMVLQLP